MDGRQRGGDPGSKRTWERERRGIGTEWSSRMESRDRNSGTSGAEIVFGQILPTEARNNHQVWNRKGKEGRGQEKKRKERIVETTDGEKTKERVPRYVTGVSQTGRREAKNNRGRGSIKEGKRQRQTKACQIGEGKSWAAGPSGYYCWLLHGNSTVGE
jgi:hypothetical protein